MADILSEVDLLVIRVPRSRGVGLLLLAAALLVVAARSDPGGRLLTGPAAVVALVLGGWDLLSGPLLRADAHGLQVRSGLRRREVGWPEVTDMSVLRDRRTELLVLELDDDLVVVSRSRLGRLPSDVLTDLRLVRTGFRD